MVLSGLHVTCAYTGTASPLPNTPPLLSRLIWSETMASADITTNKVPPLSREFGPPIFEVIASVDAWVAYGPDPDATAGPRVFVPANTICDFIVVAEDRLDWIPVA